MGMIEGFELFRLRETIHSRIPGHRPAGNFSLRGARLELTVNHAAKDDVDHAFIRRQEWPNRLGIFNAGHVDYWTLGEIELIMQACTPVFIKVL